VRSDRKSDLQLQAITLPRFLRSSAGKLAFLALAVLLGLGAWLAVPRALKEQRFRNGLVGPEHLIACAYRARLEGMRPEQVEWYLSRATDAAIADYLQRLLRFSREQAALATAPAGPREGVTFIMGEDRNPYNRFYQAATDYYTTDSAARTEHLERNLRCLADVRHYLENHRPTNGLPWGVVNIVSHSYEWGGLSVPVREGEGRTDLTSLRLGIGSGAIKPLGDSVIDCRTVFRIHGCALGRDTALLRLLGIAFGGSDLRRPRVGSSRNFVYYESVRDGGQVVSANQFFAEYWYVVYPKGQRPGNTELAKRLAERYPDVSIEWRSALGRSGPRSPGDAWYRMLSLPATWITIYPESSALPAVRTQAARWSWLEGQAELRSRLAGAGLGLDDFVWSVRDTAVLDSGRRKPAILAVGRSTIACIERELLAPDSARSAGSCRVSGTDQESLFYEWVVPAKPAVRPPGENVMFN
jgi:hypothetical protein